MSKFKIGDRVRVVNPRETSARDMGKEFIIRTDEKIWEGEQSWHGEGVFFRHKESALELAQSTSPVREVTKREIVPGVYGRVKCSKGHTGEVLVSLTDRNKEVIDCGNFDATELRTAAAVLLQLAGALE